MDTASRHSDGHSSLTRVSSVNSSSHNVNNQTSSGTPATDNGPDTPIIVEKRRLRRKVMGLKMSGPKLTDPLDYDQKYAPDEEFEEMGVLARIWKTFLDECNKYDSDMVEDWRDGLDVLLVFAGLFSAVVTSFVAQTSQRLQVDFSQVNASLTYELIEIQRAIAKNHDVDDVPRSPLDPSSTAQPSLSDIWLNGLWFTSLTLSLTTALMAVLTKQWIHQYMTVPSGSARDRARIRQLRFDSLQKWHVAMIIGLLPVLMHASLFIFFAGLVIFLRTMNMPMAWLVGGIAFAAYVAYVVTNLLPLFRPECPYKTPLTLYTYPLYNWFRSLPGRFKDPLTEEQQFIKNRTRTGPNSLIPAEGRLALLAPPRPTSFGELEQVRVQRDSEGIDASVLSWLYNSTSNPSVQRIVHQAISIAPLKCVAMLMHNVEGLDVDIHGAATMCANDPDQEDRFERLYRAIVRISDRQDMLVSSPHNKYSAFLHPANYASASRLVAQALARDHDSPHLDVLLWSKILSNALSNGPDWLELKKETSKIWSNFLMSFVKLHVCDRLLNCDGTLQHVRATPTSYGYLTISDLPNTDTPLELTGALQTHLYPSMCIVLNQILRREFTDIEWDWLGLPPDVAVKLTLVQLSFIQKTSTMDPIGRHDTLWHHLLRAIRDFSLPGGCFLASGYHANAASAVRDATCRALWVVLTSVPFRSGGALVIREKQRLLDLFFTVARQSVDSPAHSQICQWSSKLVRDILRIAFIDDSWGHPSLRLVAAIMNYAIVVPQFASLALETICRRVVDEGWLNCLGPPLRQYTDDPNLKANKLYLLKEVDIGPNNVTLDASTTFVATYIHAIPLIAKESLRKQCIAQLRDHIEMLCRIIVLSQPEPAAALRTWAALGEVVQLEDWSTYLDGLHRFIREDSTRKMFSAFHDDVDCSTGNLEFFVSQVLRHLNHCYSNTGQWNSRSLMEDELQRRNATHEEETRMSAHVLPVWNALSLVLQGLFRRFRNSPRQQVGVNIELVQLEAPCHGSVV